MAAARILIVDDSESIRTTLRLTLEFKGYEVTEAENGDEGLASILANDYDLVFSDLAMPGLSGVELIEAVKRERGADAPPIIVLSAEEREGKNRALAAGAVDCVDKPFLPQQILDLTESLTAG